MLQLIAKSVWTELEIGDRIRRGASGIEVQILNPGTDPFMKEGWYDVSLAKYVMAVHTPLVSCGGYTDDYGIETERGRDMADEVIKRASRIASGPRLNCDPVKIILHLDTPLDGLKDSGEYDRLIRWLRNKAEEHPELELYVENTIMETDQPCTCADIARIVNMMNVGTCLDICHAQMTDYLTGGKFPLDEFYRQMKGTLRWIHMSKATDEGEGYGNGTGHGHSLSRYNKEDLSLLGNIFMLNELSGYSGGICLEVQERNYNSAVNFTKTKEACESAVAVFYPEKLAG